jgi:hypothetical protein
MPTLLQQRCEPVEMRAFASTVYSFEGNEFPVNFVSP